MDGQAKERFHALWAVAERDGEYRRLLERNGELEKRYFDVLETLPPERQDVVQDFLMSCEALSWRMLEVACEVMEFSPVTPKKMTPGA